jgi:hypothetical protein
MTSDGLVIQAPLEAAIVSNAASHNEQKIFQLAIFEIAASLVSHPSGVMF